MKRDYWTPSIYSCLLIMSTVIGYFGVSDADVLLRNSNSNNNNVAQELEQSKPELDQPWRQLMNSATKDRLTRDSKEEDGRENEPAMIDESTWEQLVIRALANPTEWVQLRQALDKVDADLRALTAMENSRQQQMNQSNSKTGGKWRFTYHRVTSPQFQPVNQSRKSKVEARGKAFAAVSLANIPSREGNEQQQTPAHENDEEDEGENKMSDSSHELLKPSVINYRRESGSVGSAKRSKNTLLLDSLGQGRWKTAGESRHYHSNNNNEKDGSKESRNRVTGKKESRSRTMLEEEIAKMSLLHQGANTEAEHQPSFHWRPWIHNQNYYSYHNSKSSTSPPPSSSSTTTTPHPYTTTSNPTDSSHKNTWSQVLENFHDQLHKASFSHQTHHAHHHHHPRYRQHPGVRAPDPQQVPEQLHHQNNLAQLHDDHRHHDDDDDEEDDDNESNEVPTDPAYLPQRHRHRSSTRPELHSISDEPSVDPAFSKHPSWSLEYKI